MTRSVPSRVGLLVEEPSADITLREPMAKIAPALDVQVCDLGGRASLDEGLPGRSVGYSSVAQQSGHVVVLRIDPDRDDCEALERRLKAGDCHDRMPTPEIAATISPHMNVEENRSVSFCHFRDGVRRLVKGVA